MIFGYFVFKMASLGDSLSLPHELRHLSAATVVRASIFAVVVTTILRVTALVCETRYARLSRPDYALDSLYWIGKGCEYRESPFDLSVVALRCHG